MLDSHALADLIAELVGEHVDRATAPLVARIAELEGRDVVSAVSARLDAMERDLPGLVERSAARLVEGRIAALPAPVNGKDADPEAIRALVQELVSAIPVPKDGEPGKDGRDGQDVADIEVIQDGALVEFKFVVGDIASIFQVELPAGPAGENGKDGEPGADGVNGKDGERGLEGPPGKLAAVRAWSDEVHYEGDVVTFEGATYQALKDTGREPGTADWACLAARGGDGRDAKQLAFLGTWDPETAYEALNVVALNGASFAAKRDNPGSCPGEGWQLMASQGKRGGQGERGVGTKGDRGDPGQPVVAASVDQDGVLTLVNGDGSTVTCDFYPVLERAGL